MNRCERDYVLSKPGFRVILAQAIPVRVLRTLANPNGVQKPVPAGMLVRGIPVETLNVRLDVPTRTRIQTQIAINVVRKAGQVVAVVIAADVEVTADRPLLRVDRTRGRVPQIRILRHSVLLYRVLPDQTERAAWET